VSKTDIAVIVLAAGKGTRMKSELPKVLHSIAGKPMIGHVIDTAMNLKPKHLITVLGPNMTDVARAIAHTSQSVVQNERLGTADAVKPALAVLGKFDGIIIILYADTPLIKHETLISMVRKLDKTDVAVLGFMAKDATGYGRLVLDKNNNLKKIIECKDATNEEKKINLANSGIFACKGKILPKLIKQVDNKNAKGEYYLTDIVAIASKDGYKTGYITGDEQEVQGVNDRAQLSDAEYIYQQRMRYKFMVDGVTMPDPESVYFWYDTKIAKDVTIGQNVVFGEEVEIESNVEIRPFCHIVGAKIGKSSIIGPFARLRPGTNIAANVRIGNYVEIKKTDIKAGTKIPHLSYIGDAKIGKDANIGAGTITCNYDGFSKYVTEIGDGVFIGSNSVLVAPVKIGTDAFVAAGSTITKNVPKEALAIGRAKQTEKLGWIKIFRKRKSKMK